MKHIYPLPRPAGLGDKCDYWHQNPDLNGPFLVQCAKPAACKLVLRNGFDGYPCTVKRCAECAEKLRQQVGITILYEESLMKLNQLVNKSCPACNEPHTRVALNEDQEKVLKCPRCGTEQPIPADIEHAESGAQRLPGMEVA